MAKTDIFRVGPLTFIDDIRIDEGAVGYNDRARLIHDGYGTIDLWGTEDDYRAAAKFFSKLATQQAEIATKESAGGCGCSCSGKTTY